MKFDWSISVGTIIQLCSLVALAYTSYVRLKVKIDLLEVKVDLLLEERERTLDWLKQLQKDIFSK